MRYESDRWFNVYRMPRPYLTPKSTAEWQEINPRRVSITALATTQEWIYQDGILSALYGLTSVSGDEYPHLVVFESRLWVVDGHHRIVVQKLCGGQSLDVRLYYN